MRSHWNIAGLILEGISGVGKSTLLQALVKHPRYVEKPFMSSLVFTEHHTQRVLEAKERRGGLAVVDHVDLVDGLVGVVERVARQLAWMDWAERDRVNHRTSYLFERLHLSHVCRYPAVSWSDVEPLDRRLAKLDCKMCLLYIDDKDALEQRHRDRGAEWLDVVAGWDVGQGGAADFLLRRQEQFVKLCERSALETRIIDVTGKTSAAAVAEVLNFWDIN